MKTKIKVWKTIKLGIVNGPKTGEEYIKLICEKKKIIVPTVGSKYMGPVFKLSESACNALESSDFKVSPVGTEIEIVKMSLKDLGLKEGATLSDILEKGSENGGTSCPLDLGPELRLTHEDQPSGERLVIITKPVIDHNDFPLMFSVESDAYLWLETSGGFSSNNMFTKNQEFVFQLRK